VPAGVDDDRPRGDGLGGLELTGHQPLDDVDLGADAERPQPLGVQARERERAVRRACGGALQPPADPAAHAPQVLAPVLARPDLEPVHDKAVAAAATRSRRGEDGEVLPEGMHDVVPVAMPEEVPEHAGREEERRKDPPAAAAGVQADPRSNRHDPHTAEIRLVARLPLAESQIGHLVPRGDEALRESAVPAFRAADGERIQAVVGNADTHRSGHKRCRANRPRCR
jgi:hypothetical protein